MLIWNANFQIPRSDKQCAWVYAVVQSVDAGYATVGFYSDSTTTELMFTRRYGVLGVTDVYAHLLTLEDFSLYSFVEQ